MATANTPRDERRVIAWIGQGVVIEGRISSAQDLRIDGKIEGTITVGDHELIVGDTAAIRANLAAKSIVISGSVVGNVTASEGIHLQPTASVEGDISAPRLIIADGALVKGKVEAGKSVQPRRGTSAS